MTFGIENCFYVTTGKNYCSQFIIDRLSGEIKLFIILFKLTKLVKFVFALI